MPLPLEQLDLSKSADSQEKFRTRRVVPWEIAVVIFYLAAMVGAAMAIGLDNIRANLHRLDLCLALGLVFLLGVMLIVAAFKTRSIKRDADYRRAILVAVLEGGHQASLITDPRHRTIYANTKMQQMMQSSKLFLIDDLPFCLASGHDHELDTFKDFVESGKAGTPSDMISAYWVSDQSGWIRCQARPIEGWKGYTHWSFDNITSSHDDNQRLLRERVRLIEFMDHAPVGFFSVDEAGHFIFTNDTFVTWLGAEDRDLCNGTFSLHDIMIDPDGSLPPYAALPLENDLPTQRGEVRIRAFNGREFQASLSHTILKAPDGSVRTRSIIRDLTPERAWKTALKQSEDRFQRFFEEAPLGIALVDNRGQLTECNEEFSQMLGHPVHGLLTKSLFDYIKSDDKPKLENILDKIRSSHRPEPIEIAFVTKNGASAIVQMFASPFMGETGVVLHFINVTERKNLEAQFAQSQKMQAVGQLAGGVAHDFNNLLTAMIGFCDLLLIRHRAGDPSFADIMQIKQNANRAANLVRQLLAFSRQQTLQPKILDITEIITEVSHLLRRLLGANIELRINHERDVGTVKIDQGQMEQVLVNLAVNARDAMPQGGNLSVQTRNLVTKREREMTGSEKMPPGEWVVLDITDTGTGIPTEVLERIFDPFFSTKPLGQGTGLGLSTVYGIVRQSNGYIGVETQLGKGTVFSIYLPRMAEEKKAVAGKIEDAPKAEDLTGSSRILLVEDEDAVRSFSVRALQNKGYEVFEANCAENAWDMLTQDKLTVDLMVSDVIMPGMDGIELGRKVRELHPNLTIIFMSGYTEDKFKDDMGEDVHFLPKPFTLKQLAEKVKDVMDNSKKA
jgi:two-component system cell cycle sensor histidine kinase/response regulator CckA